MKDAHDLEVVVHLAEVDDMALAAPAPELRPFRYWPREPMLAGNDVLARLAEEGEVLVELLLSPFSPRVHADLEEVVFGLLRVMDHGHRFAFARLTFACTRSQTPGLARRL